MSEIIATSMYMFKCIEIWWVLSATVLYLVWLHMFDTSFYASSGSYTPYKSYVHTRTSLAYSLAFYMSHNWERLLGCRQVPNHNQCYWYGSVNDDN